MTNNEYFTNVNLVKTKTYKLLKIPVLYRHLEIKDEDIIKLTK